MYRVGALLFLCLAFPRTDALIGNGNCKGILPSCSCSDTVIDCSNAGINTTEIFLNIPNYYPYLISLNMTGNKFEYLEQDLFGRGVRMPYLEKLDLSNCKIIGIHGKAFIGLPKLDELNLARNALSFRNGSSSINAKDIPGRSIWATENFLRPIASHLKILDLSDAFDRKERQDAIGFLGNLTALFNTSDLRVLQYLNLSSNHITFLASDLFCQAPVLEYLYLASNRLIGFSADEGCLPALMELHLQSNYIRRISAELMDLIEHRSVHLQTVYMADNPFTCDCDSQNFIRWARMSNKLVDKAQYVCTRAKPREFANQALLTVLVDKLQCSADASEYLHGVYILCAIAFVGLIALLLCIVYTNRGILCRRSIRTWMPLGGYQTLGREPEVKAEMV